MCLITKQKKPKVADKDIVCYKAGGYNKQKNIFWGIYYCFEYELSKLYKTKLKENIIVEETRTCADGMFLPLPAKNLDEQRKERKRTIQERCEKVAEIVNNKKDFSFVMCQLNNEGDL